MVRRPALILGLGAMLACTWAVSAPAAHQATPAMKLVGFATRSDGNNTPTVEVKPGGVITKCLEKRRHVRDLRDRGHPGGIELSAVLVREQQDRLHGLEQHAHEAITTPRPCHMGFRKNGLKKGRYTFQFILNGRPHVLGSVTRKC